MLKKLMSMFLACIMLAGLIVVPAHAEETAASVPEMALDTVSGEIPEELNIDLDAAYEAVMQSLGNPDASMELLPLIEETENMVPGNAAGDHNYYESEPNDYSSEANRVYHDYTVSGILTSNDADYFGFILNSSSSVSIPMVTDRYDMCIGVFNYSTGKLIGSTYVDTYKSGLYTGGLTGTLSAGTYYMLVFSVYDLRHDYMFYLNAPGAKKLTLSAPSITVANNADSGKPKISWNSVSNASQYQVYYSTDKTNYSLLGTTSSLSYTHSNAVPGTAYSYKVRAVNGSVYSSYSSVKSITCDCARPVVTISASSTGKPKLTWSAVTGATKYEIHRATSKSGTYSRIYTTSSTSFTNSGAEGGKTYYYKVKAVCGASSYGNSAFSEVKSFTVAIPLAITSNPSSKTVTAGEKATFSVKATGTGLTYRWQYRSSSTGEWKKTSFSGYNTAKLTVTTKESHNGYQYRCKVTDSSGKTAYSKRATLTVKPSFGFLKHPSDVSVNVGTKATFSVEAVGTSLTYRWQYKTPTSDDWKNTSFSGYNTATLFVTTKESQNGYQYRCKITDANGKTDYSNPATLTVVSPLVIKTSPVDQVVDAGEKAVFTVKASGTGLTYCWQYRTSSSGTWKNTELTGYNTATLTVTAKESRNGYQYRCKVTDSTGKNVYSKAATLTIYEEPEITSQPQIAHKADGTVQIRIKATGVGLTYQWQYKVADGWKDTSRSGNKTAYLDVTSCTTSYTFRCKVTDVKGVSMYSDSVKYTPE